MRKVFANKWFILATLLTCSLSTFSYMTYRKADAAAAQASKNSCISGDKSNFLWDMITSKVPSVAFH